jgi:hypothetical protein
VWPWFYLPKNAAANPIARKGGIQYFENLSKPRSDAVKPAAVRLFGFDFKKPAKGRNDPYEGVREDESDWYGSE